MFGSDVKTTDARAIRVAYVVHTFEVGGIERCVARLASHLDRKLFRPTVICLNRSGAAARWIERDDVEVIELHKRAGNDLGVVRRLAKVLRELQIDVVHSHNWGTLVETSVARRRAGTPVHVHTEHGQGLHAGLRGLKQWMRARVRRWAFGGVDQLLSCADAVRPLISSQCGIPAEQIEFMPNGVELREERESSSGVAELRRSLGVGDKAMIAGSVGRLVEVKDFGVGIQAVAMLAGRGQDVHLVLVGDGPEEGSLRQLAAQLGAGSRVHLVGRHEDVSNWLRLFDVYINCSRSEAMSLGVLEAMAAGCPIVVTDVGDNRLLVEGKDACGMVVPARSPDQLADALEALLGDHHLRAEFSRNAELRYASRYSTQRMIENHAQLYRRLIGRRPAADRVLAFTATTAASV